MRVVNDDEEWTIYWTDLALPERVNEIKPFQVRYISILYLPIYLFILPIYLSIYLCIFTYLSIYIYLSIYLPIEGQSFPWYE